MTSCPGNRVDCLVSACGCAREPLFGSCLCKGRRIGKPRQRWTVAHRTRPPGDDPTRSCEPSCVRGSRWRNLVEPIDVDRRRRALLSDLGGRISARAGPRRWQSRPPPRLLGPGLLVAPCCAGVAVVVVARRKSRVERYEMPGRAQSAEDALDGAVLSGGVSGWVGGDLARLPTCYSGVVTTRIASKSCESARSRTTSA